MGLHTTKLSLILLNMRWRVTTTSADPRALEFCKRWVWKFDCDALSSVSVKRGRKGYGVYGWCDYIPGEARPYYIQLHIPGPFPYTVVTKEASAKLKVYGLQEAIPENQSVASRNVCTEDETVEVRFETRTVLCDAAEGLVFLFGHELHHYLAGDGHFSSKDNEYNADGYGRLLLDRFRNIVR